MDLQISVFLLFVLFTAGHSLNCYQCINLTRSCEQTTCSSGFTNCFSATYITVSPNNTSTVKAKLCVRPSDCATGFISIGDLKTSSYCCNTDLCNVQDAPEPSNVPNGKKCYYCDGQNCSNNIMSCSGTEDYCIAGTFVNQTVVVKGCVSKSICDAATSISSVDYGSFTCCEGNLCNSAQSVTQSFLFLCCSLLSYFLLH